ncbi:MAG: DUF1080 domain-containing protein [Acidobacteria bacterium]|nr:MAG: DUF1080 domain-containing protein [Acidobacteriota bacterium]
MKTRTLLLAFLAALAPAVEAQTHQLFNGKNLDGWIFLSNQPGPAGFAVNHGVLETTDGNKGMLCYTKEKIGKATIRVVYKMSNEKGNSGVFIRIPTEPKSEADAINKGIEVQIDNRDDDWHCTGVLYSMTKAMARPYKPSGEWNTMEITLDGLRTIVKVNGTLVTDYDGVSPVPEKKKSYEPERGPRPPEGYIALQHHDTVAVISFKEVSVTPLKH